MFLRRFIAIGIILITTVVMVPLAPLVVLLSWVITKVTKWKSLDRAVLFAYGYLYYEIMGVSKLVWVGVRYRNDYELMIAKSYDVQRWWAQALFDLAAALFKLRFTVSGEDAITGDGFILVSRHTNVADNFFPLVFVGTPRQKPIRYILKKELRAVTTLDIGGHRLPNYFIDRTGLQTERELERVRELLVTCDNDDSLLIYPEGTRFSREKQERLRARDEMKEQVERWPDLLPPRLGGITALLDANPGKDVVFLCHNGFEGSGGFGDLIDGVWLNTDVNLQFWRVPYEDIGQDYQTFIFDQWDRMQSTLAEMRS